MSLPSNRRRNRDPAAAVLCPCSAAHAQAEPTIQELLQRIEEQEQKILVLERKLEIQDEAAKAAAATTPVVKASPKGFSFQSADGQNLVKLRGTVHFDGRFFESDDPSRHVTDTWQATRVRPILEGTVGGIYDFKFMPDFGQGKTVIQDAYVTARFLPQFQVTAGKFKAPVGLERLQSANDIRFVSRAFPTSLAPNRDIGLQVAGNVLSDRLNYAVAWTNGVNDGGSTDSFGDVDTNNGKEWSGRLFALPFGESDVFALRGLGLGIAGTYALIRRDHLADPAAVLQARRRSRRSSVTAAAPTRTIADGERTRIAPQFYYYVGRFGLLGEYTTVSQDVAAHDDGRAGARDRSTPRPGSWRHPCS